jgi:hypothetical protein
MTGAQRDKGHPMEEGGQGPQRAAADDDLALKITHVQMEAAVGAGDAIPLALSGGWLTQYRDASWVQSEICWIRITDEATAAEIDRVAARIAKAVVVEDAD